MTSSWLKNQVIRREFPKCAAELSRLSPWNFLILKRTDIEIAKDNDVISPPSISCKSHFNFFKTAKEFIDYKYRRNNICGPLAEMVHKERNRKILKHSEVNKTLPGVMNTSKIGKTETFLGDGQRIILVITACKGHYFRFQLKYVCSEQLY